MAADSVKILYKGGTAETEVKKSRFIANLKPVESEEEATAFIAEMKKKYWDARHNCQAFTIGMNHELTGNLQGAAMTGSLPRQRDARCSMCSSARMSTMSALW